MNITVCQQIKTECVRIYVNTRIQGVGVSQMIMWIKTFLLSQCPCSESSVHFAVHIGLFPVHCPCFCVLKSFQGVEFPGDSATPTTSQAGLPSWTERKLQPVSCENFKCNVKHHTRNLKHLEYMRKLKCKTLKWKFKNEKFKIFKMWLNFNQMWLIISLQNLFTFSISPLLSCLLPLEVRHEACGRLQYY